MLSAPQLHATVLPPRPAAPLRQRSQAESFLVLRRNPLELWGAPAYEVDIAAGNFAGRRQFLLNQPEAIRHVLVTNAANYQRTEATRRVLAPVLGEGLFLAEGEAWRHQRRTIAPALAPRSLPMLASHVVAATQAAVRALRTQRHRPVEMLPILQNLALEIAGQSMFSVQMARFGGELRRLLTIYGQSLAQPGLADLLMPQGWVSPLDARRARFRVQWLAFLDEIIAERRAQVADGAPRDLFDLLLAATDPETEAPLSHEKLRDEISTLILAGHETTAITLFWALYLASLYPEQQALLAAEAAEAPTDSTDTTALPRIRAHIDETLRLYPPAFLIVREAIGADEIPGHSIAPGSVVTISPWVLHRHRKLWRGADHFDGTRFLAEPTPARFTYLPFGAGPRICIGASFALTEACLILKMLLREFRFSLPPHQNVLPVGRVTTQPGGRCWFLLRGLG